MNGNEAWLVLLDELMIFGQEISPRGMRTIEIPQKTIKVDMTMPVVTCDKRKLGYRFMAAEAHWILTGDDKVETISPYSKTIANFSDDGERFFGAYGPKIMGQLPYVLDKLRQDPDTRQAGLTIWRENPPQTKDYPCTIAIWFQIRKGVLNLHVFMRSSDAWLGIPYDVFNFSMLAHYVKSWLYPALQLQVGCLYLTMASSHLYETNWKDAMEARNAPATQQHPVPTFTQTGPLLDHLGRLRLTNPGDPLRWWE